MGSHFYGLPNLRSATLVRYIGPWYPRLAKSILEDWFPIFETYVLPRRRRFPLSNHARRQARGTVPLRGMYIIIQAGTTDCHL